MLPNKSLNIFYEEPDPDRWFKYDRYLRKLIRRLVRGKARPGGVMMVALNLMRGLDKLGVKYRYNDYKYIKKHPEEIACIIGKSHVLFDKKWKNPIIFGAGIYSHPVDCLTLLETHPNVKRILVPGPWMRNMFMPYYGDKVIEWPVGLDTDFWHSVKSNSGRQFDFLIYDKVLWNYNNRKKELIDPLCEMLDSKGLTYQFIRYGYYKHPELVAKLSNSKSVIFLCEHETQGLAYQQVLSTNTPILAWDGAGFWQDPSYYPHKVQYEPVSSVPYWDERCGVKFTGIVDLEQQLALFLDNHEKFNPRQYILENLTLEICAQNYLDIVNQIANELI